MKHNAVKSSRMRAKHLMSRTGYSSGGMADKAQDAQMISKAVHEHEGALHKGSPKTSIKLKEGGAVEGRASGGRLDKLARGGRHNKKPNVTVNVMNHPSAPAAPMPIPVPPPGPAAGLPPMGAKPPLPPVGPMAGPAGPGPGPMLPPGPGGMKTGGRLGGKAAPKMTAGAVSGEGRLQKIKAYGTKPKAK